MSLIYNSSMNNNYILSKLQIITILLQKLNFKHKAKDFLFNDNEIITDIPSINNHSLLDQWHSLLESNITINLIKKTIHINFKI